MESLEEIARKVERARVEYLESGASDLSDDEYDALVSHLRANGRVVHENQGIPEGPWKIRRHLRPMEGIPWQIRSITEMPSVPGWLSLKYDGISVELQYREGCLEAVVLRGDAQQGEDVLDNARHVWGIPSRVHGAPTVLGVYGELVISWNNLAALNEARQTDSLPPYKTPRNAVSGIRRRGARPHHLSLMTFRPFSFSCDEWPARENAGDLGNKLIDARFLRALSEEQPPARRFNPIEHTLVAPERAWEKTLEIGRTLDEFTYQLDGTVFEIDYRRAKIKFPPTAKIATVLEVTEQLGRTGVVAPVAVFDPPVELGGVSVTRASAHNATLVAERLSGLGPGAKVLVTRRGDVIPHIESVVEVSSTPWSPRVTCPSCGAPVVEDGSTRRCSADPSECPGTTTGLIIKFVREVGIEGIGPSIAASMVASGIVTTPAELFTLNEEVLASVTTPEGRQLGEPTAVKILRSVRSHWAMTFAELLGAIGIPGCARSVMETVASTFNDPEALRSASVEELTELDGIGPERAAAIRDFITYRWDSVVEPLLEIIHLEVSKGGPLSGLCFCITLELKSGPRPQVEARIRAAGGAVKSSVSKRVTHVVCNSRDAATSKLVAAAKLGIPIISEDELLAMMGASSDTETGLVPIDAEF